MISTAVRTGALMACAGLSTGVAAQSPGLLQAAVERHESVSLHNWRFDRVRQVDGREVRERCVGIDYRKAECRLRLVGGEPPDDKALERYAENVAQPVEDNLPNIDLADYIQADSVRGAGQDAAVARYAFDTPNDGDDDPMLAAQTAGTAEVDREEGFVRALSIRNGKPFKPATGIKVQQFELRFEFAEFGDAVLATRVGIKARGRAFLVKSFEQDESVAFENIVAPY